MKKLFAVLFSAVLAFGSFSPVAYASVNKKETKIILKQGRYFAGPTSETKYASVSNYQDFYNVVDSAIKNVDSSILITMGKGYLKGDTPSFMSYFQKITSYVATGSFVESYTIYKMVVGNTEEYFIEFKYTRDISEVRRKTGQINDKVKSLVSSITSPKKGDYNNIKAIHDYIINNCRYDVEGFESNNVPVESHTAYGVLINNVAVCDGYAITMKKMLDSIGIQNMVIIGTGDNIPHAWNLVKYNGKWYHVDCTWDDPIGDRPMLRTDYFLKSDQFMGKTHTWNRANYPSAGELNLKSKVGVKYKRNLVIKKG